MKGLVRFLRRVLSWRGWEEGGGREVVLLESEGEDVVVWWVGVVSRGSM